MGSFDGRGIRVAIDVGIGTITTLRASALTAHRGVVHSLIASVTLAVGEWKTMLL